MTVKFGWKAGSEQYPPQQLLEYAVAAEDAGFESIDGAIIFIRGANTGRPALFGRGFGNWGSPQRVFSYRTVAKLPNSSGAAARSGSIDSRTMERRSSFIQ